MFLVFRRLVLYVGVNFFKFIPLRFHSVSYICGFMSFAKFGQFSDIIQEYSQSSLSPPCQNPHDRNASILVIVLHVPVTLFMIFSLSSLNCLK
jgi:hypothetical protein